MIYAHPHYPPGELDGFRSNVRHYQPGHPEVAALRPGDLLLRVRDRLARLTDEGER